ncbi:hypothetical protein F2Q70_00001275 [Brassica cretica]|uniref:Uncharacterized protein n=1 Tax=Brassica cretica TaxID=69181 RepID=A0A8S9J2F2_BRACR|nr:hypothetical protein F2Q70_00001275 [Brassica cretica]
MSSGAYYRSWMDKPHLDPNTNLLTEEYVQGIGELMRLVQQQPNAKSGFSRNYKVWYLHGETGYEYGSTSEPQPVSELQPDIRLEESRTDIDYGVGTEQMAVPKRKGGRLVGLARRASSYPASSSQAPYADPMILEELHDKDERIGALEEQNTTILSENATIRSENATILAELASQKKFNAEIMQKLDRLMSSSS